MTMKSLKALAAAVVAALCIGTASAQYATIPPNAIGPLAPYSVVCNATASLGYPGVGAANCSFVADQTSPQWVASGAGTGECATAPANIKGGSHSGSFTCAGTAGASTLPITLPTAPNGWACVGSDVTQGTAVTTSVTSTTGATLKFTSVANTDVIQFACFGY
jgi:hypothetical protein